MRVYLAVATVIFMELVKELYQTPSTEQRKEVISIHRYLLVSKGTQFSSVGVATVVFMELVKELYPPSGGRM